MNVRLAIASLLVGTAFGQQTPMSNQQGASTTPRQATSRKSHPGASANKPDVVSLATQRDKASYAIGMSVGKNLRRDSVDIDPRILLLGLEDALNGNKLLLSDDDVKAVMSTLQEDVRKKQEEKRLALIDANKKAGDAFLASNSAKDGIVTLPSGLQYKALIQGTGPKPLSTDTVVCNYRGTLLDGTEFDSSYKRGQPATFAVDQVIKGWTEALQLMPVGSKWQLFIPPELAYGENGQGPTIGPNSTLIFEVELVSINK